ncbi:MAG: TonB-dependent receptor domain-containing protein [Caulobacterales bacterium]
MSIRKLAVGVALSALVLAASTATRAQEISGAVAGQVIENGKPAGGVKVVVTNTATGVSQTTTSTDDGFYTVRNLPVGGPYTVKATASDAVTQTAQIEQIGIGEPYQLDLALGAAAQEIVVTGQATVKNAVVATGPRTTFTAIDIQKAPSFAGDLKDLARINPFVTIDAANSNAMTIAGTNSHFNTIYLDGVRQSDDFGLNNSGYPTQRSPFSIDVVRAFNVEVSPYEVQYGNFQGGILNVVTKSGSNDFHGSVDYSWDSDAMSGKVIGSQALRTTPAAPDRKVTTHFSDKATSATISGPIWKDHVFFLFGYSQYKGVGAATFNPQDQPGANPIAGVNQADVTTVQTDVKGGYGYDPLNYGGTGPVVDTKYFGKLDWYITDNQHLFVSYQNTDGTTYNVPNGSTSSKILNLQSNDYNFEQRLTAWTADLTSHWTDQLSTEVEYSYKDVESPTKLFTSPFAEFKINLPSTGTIFLGPDISRQANNLGNVDQQIKFKGNYKIGDHVVIGGYEHEQLKEFDLFVQDATGVYTFSTACGPGAAVGGTNNVYTNLQAHVACALTYQNAFDNNPNTAATSATNTTDTLYAEDEWRVTPELTVRGGLRYEIYGSSTKPLLNPRFVSQYGYANNGTINGESVLMPRFGFNWHPDPSWTITGGAGLFSGGNPGVYTYDSYTNPGNLLGLKTYTCAKVNCSDTGTLGNPNDPNALTIAGSSALMGVTGSSIPTDVKADITTIAGAGAGTANALDPHFKPPSVWKASISIIKNVDFNDYAKYIGIANLLGDGWRFHGDLLAAKTQEAVMWQDIWEMQYQMTPARAAALGLPSNVAPDGRPLFDPTRYSPNPNNLSPAPTQAYPWLTGTTTRSSGADVLLTNTTGGDALVWAIGVTKTFKDWGLDLDYTYSHQNVRDVAAATSSVATSNFNNEITADPNHPGVATSNYQILYEHRISVNYSHKWWGDNATSLRLFFYDRAGLPFSYAFCTTSSSSCASPSFNGPFDQLFGQSATSTTHQLLYVPMTDSTGKVTATSDPLVTYAPGFDLNGFNAFLQSSRLSKFAGHIAPRNGFRSADVLSADLQIAQELPAGFPNGAKGEVYLDIINLANLIDKNWGIDDQVGFPYAFAPVVATNCQFSGLVVPGATPAKPLSTYPTCAAGRGNFYQFNTFRPQVTPQGVNQFSTVQSLASPPVATWVIKIGVRYKF